MVVVLPAPFSPGSPYRAPAASARAVHDGARRSYFTRPLIYDGRTTARARDSRGSTATAARPPRVPVSTGHGQRPERTGSITSHLMPAPRSRKLLAACPAALSGLDGYHHRHPQSPPPRPRAGDRLVVPGRRAVEPPAHHRASARAAPPSLLFQVDPRPRRAPKASSGGFGSLSLATRSGQIAGTGLPRETSRVWSSGRWPGPASRADGRGQRANFAASRPGWSGPLRRVGGAP